MPTVKRLAQSVIDKYSDLSNSESNSDSEKQTSLSMASSSSSSLGMNQLNIRLKAAGDHNPWEGFQKRQI